MQMRPVLATSDSNIAVDNLAEGAQSCGLNVVRVGRPEKITPQLDVVLLDSLVRKRQAAENDTLQDGSSSKNVSFHRDGNFDQLQSYEDYRAKMKIIKEADVICSTTVGTGSNLFSTVNFGAILIDEAAQATELSALVPIVLRGADHLVLVGDHCQLPPSVACFEAEIRGLSLSLFGRLAAQGLRPFFLDTQFRMHPMIVAFSAQEFYHGKLKTGIDETERPPPQGFAWPRLDAGIAFVHVEGPESSDGQSKSNYNEVERVADILVEVLAASELSCADIGVVTPYSAQVKVLRQSLRGGLIARLRARGVDPLVWSTTNARGRTGLQLLEIASVDAFQGREKELIIFSAVRSNRHGNMGFLSDQRRLNVMITRARRGLIVVGDMGTLKADDAWNRWLEWATSNGVRTS